MNRLQVAILKMNLFLLASVNGRPLRIENHTVRLLMAKMTICHISY